MAIELDTLHLGKAFQLSGTVYYEVLQCVHPLNQTVGRALYKIKDTTTHLEFALKLFDLRLNKRKELEREMVTLNKANRYPEIFPRCQQFGTLDKNWAFLRLDWMPGVALSSAVSGPPADKYELGFRLDILRSICYAVGKLHQCHLLHRDLKPDNILLRHRQRPRDGVMLIDLGLSSQDRARVEEGSLGYHAPEQSGNREFQLNEAADVFAVGQIGWWLMTGAPRNDAYPNTDYSDWSPVGMRPLTVHQPLATAALGAALDKAMAYHPSQRYNKIHYLAQELRRIKI